MVFGSLTFEHGSSTTALVLENLDDAANLSPEDFCRRRRALLLEDPLLVDFLEGCDVGNLVYCCNDIVSDREIRL